MPKFIEMEDEKFCSWSFCRLNALCLVVAINMKNHLRFKEDLNNLKLAYSARPSS